MNILYYERENRYEGGKENVHTIIDATLEDVILVPCDDGDNCEIKVKISGKIFTIETHQCFDSDEDIESMVKKIIKRFNECCIFSTYRTVFVSKVFEDLDL